MNAPRTFLRVAPDRLVRLRDRYAACLADPASERCPAGDYSVRILADLDAALAQTGRSR
jgi:hypothetical protein